MDSETTKIAVFAVAFVALLLVGRWLSGRSQGDPFTPPPPPIGSDGLRQEAETAPVPAVGYDLPFPPEAAKVLSEMPPDDRPIIVNYYFEKTDLVAGPPDPTDFMDTLCVEHDNPPDEPRVRFTTYTVVTTPTTLTRLLKERPIGAIFAVRYLIVERFHVGTILAGYLNAAGTEADQTEPDPAEEPAE
jgi:hypothetical protein